MTTVQQKRDIEHRFTNHPPESDAVAERFDATTALFIHTASAVLEMTPPSAERDLAIVKLEEASMWAKAGIARHQ